MNISNNSQTPIDILASNPMLSEESKLIISAIKEIIKNMKNELQVVIESRNEEVKQLKGEVFELKKEVSSLKALVDDADAYERKDTVIISGPNIPHSTPGENSSEVVRKLIKDHLKINLSADGISTAHRLGQKSMNQAVDKRSFIVKLVRRDLKYDLISASKNQNPRRIYVTESLTPTRRTIFNALRKMKAAKLIKRCSSYDDLI